MTLLATSTLKKITVAVLAMALVSWVGVKLYYFLTIRSSPSITTSTSSSEISPAPLETDKIVITKGKDLVNYQLSLVYDGILESKSDDEWTIKGKEEKIIFRITPTTWILKITGGVGEEGREEIGKDEIKLGDSLRVTVLVVGREGFMEEIEKGDLRNQNTIAVALLNFD